MNWKIFTCLTIFTATVLTSVASLSERKQQPDHGLLLQAVEIRKLLKHGPWPPAMQPDPSNRVSGNKDAIELGRKLFFDARLSSNNSVSCATCHNPGSGWSDGRAKGKGLETVDRNSQSIHNVRFNRWFGWGGANDNLWAQSFRPILDVREMGGSAERTTKLILNDKSYKTTYIKLFVQSPDKQPGDLVLANTGKLLAAFQETVITPRTSFDNFRDALEAGDWKKAASYPKAAQRGAAIFVGKGQCRVCHAGPQFTSGEFHNIGIPHFIGKGRVDSGRHAGIAKLRTSPWTLAGKYNDDPKKRGAWASRQVLTLHRNFGEFRIPTLRNLTRTKPFMHNGSLATIEDVVLYYSNINPERLHNDGEQLLKPLHLSKREVTDLVAFLKTLSE